MFTETDFSLADNIIREIQKGGYTEITAPLSPQQTTEAIDSFIALITSPDGVKNEFRTELLVNGRLNSDIGYIRRTKSDGLSDNKEFFHYHPQVETVYQSILSKHNPVVDRFFNNARIVYQAAMITADKILRVFDQIAPGIRSEFFDEEQLDPGMLRFLKYDPALDGEIIGKDHCDIGAFTMGIRETGSGLEAQINGIWQEVNYNPNTWLVFRGLQEVPDLEKLLIPLPHRVRQVGPNYTPEVARASMVCFMDSKNYPLGKT